MRQLLEMLRPVHAHVHHMIGVPSTLIDLLVEYGIKYDWTIHDYYTICPRVNLIDANHSYCGEPDDRGCNRCLAGAWRRPRPAHCEVHRKLASRIYPSARRCAAGFRTQRRCAPSAQTVFSTPAHDASPSPGITARHREPGCDPDTGRGGSRGGRRHDHRNQRLRTAACVCSRRTGSQTADRIYVIGSTDRDAVFCRHAKCSRIGRYTDQEVYGRLATTRCHVAFLPSLCPESYMYTLSELMAAGLFTVCFDLGAQASRLRQLGLGASLALEVGTRSDQRRTCLRRRGNLLPNLRRRRRRRHASYSDLLTSYYGFSAEERKRFFVRPAGTRSPAKAKPHFVQGNANACFH